MDPGAHENSNSNPLSLLLLLLLHAIHSLNPFLFLSRPKAQMFFALTHQRQGETRAGKGGKRKQLQQRFRQQQPWSLFRETRRRRQQQLHQNRRKIQGRAVVGLPKLAVFGCGLERVSGESAPISPIGASVVLAPGEGCCSHLLKAPRCCCCVCSCRCCCCRPSCCCSPSLLPVPNERRGFSFPTECGLNYIRGGGAHCAVAVITRAAH